MSDSNAAVGVFDTHLQAEDAINELQKQGMDIKKLSILGRELHTEEQVVGYYNMGDRVAYWGKGGAFWGGIWGMLLGAGFFWIPGLGPLLVAGPIVGMIVGGVEGAAVVGSLSALGAALCSIGLPVDSVLAYETAIKGGKYILIYHGTQDEVEKVRLVLEETKAEETALHVHSRVAGV